MDILITEEQLRRLCFMLLGGGLCLIAEHAVTHGGFDGRFGHEWVGLIFVIISMVILTVFR